jgi:hypothetical protein
MATNISADDGVVSGVAGLKTSADNSGVLALQTNGTTALTVSTTLAIGVGSTPSYGTSGQVLTSGGSSASPTWSTPTTTSPAGSTGQVQYNNAGAFGAISSGTSGQVLTSAGSGSAPTWSTPSGGSWIYINTVTASAASTVDVTGMNSTYDMYMIVAQNVSSSDSVAMNAKIYLGGTLQTSSLYGYIIGVMDSTWSVTSNTGPTDSRGFLASAGYINTGGTPDRTFIIYCPNVNSTSKAHGFWGTGQENRTTSRPHVYHFSVNYASIGSAMTGIQLYMGSGTLTGTFRLYGLKNS